MESSDILNDPIHGRIELSKLERDLVQTPTFMRLGRIQQLGLASMIFPGATHTRLAHSLGTLHIATRIALQLQLDSEEEEKLRVAALLHDIGQYPLSHAIEFVYRKLGEPATSAQELFKNTEHLRQSQESSTFLQSAVHSVHLNENAKDKKIAATVIRERPDLRRVFEKHNKTDFFVDEIVRIISGEHVETLFRHLMDSDYDCDRLDFVQRDAMMAGVTYGRIDLDFLIENLVARRYPPTAETRVLAVNKRKALHTLEHYLTARYYMYSQVIHHKDVKSLELMAKAIFLELAKRGKVYADYKEITNKVIPSDEFLSFDDSYFFRSIFEYSRQADKDDPLKILIDNLIHKRPLNLIREYRKLFDRTTESADEEYHRVKNHLFNERNLISICDEAQVERGKIVVEEIPVQFVPIGPLLSLKQILAGQGSVEEIGSSLQLYNEERDDTEFLLADRSSILYELSKVELKIVRLYFSGENPEEEKALLHALDGRLR